MLSRRLMSSTLTMSTRSALSSQIPLQAKEQVAQTQRDGATSRRTPLTVDSIRPSVLEVEYAVRGAVPQKAAVYAERLAKGEKLPFTELVYANIGNPQQKGLNQKPITWWRQVASLMEYPDLLDSPLAPELFKPDAIARAKELREEMGSVGAYTANKGDVFIRKNVAAWLEKRDGHAADVDNIYLTAGASAGISLIMNVAICPGDGVLIPIPQYPLYTATIASVEAHPLPYYLNEEKGWSFDESSVAEALTAAADQKMPIKALVVINPGNPTGNCLSQENMESIIKVCYDNNVLLLADEVYQENVFDPEHKPFHSFKKVLASMGAPYSTDVGLVSFHSISKGYSGECGRRGGFMELVNLDKDVLAQINKISSVALCPPASGQIGVDCLVRPPQEGGESFAQWRDETEGIKNALRDRSLFMRERFAALEGMTCQQSEGAMYLFPRLHLPAKAIEAAKAADQSPDLFYCLSLLENTGICLVPGDGFGQADGQVHFRTTALSPGVEQYSAKLAQFHEDFMAKYA